MKTVVIVQARMGSTRLPGKVLLPLRRRTVLAEVLSRCGMIAGVDAVCCAVPSADKDVAVEAERNGVEVAFGPDADVLRRFVIAANQTKADVVMRVTADCPLLDPALCAEVISLRARLGVDYASNNLKPSFPHGLDAECFTIDALMRADRNAQPGPQREHVTPWLRKSPEVTRAGIEGPGGDTIDQRWTLDYPEDYEFFTAVFTRLADPPPTDWRTTLEIVKRAPDLSKINISRFDTTRRGTN